ncbi:hypothetical protein [Ferrimicrobium sp.]|uniref:hypothetical protein n=1 Tax=Ferrimicrobium sp. TaxID=2926050 RepID=UPI00262A2D1D|nr:hypothetical protein [Ferrimicrobium sp.]
MMAFLIVCHPEARFLSTSIKPTLLENAKFASSLRRGRAAVPGEWWSRAKFANCTP